MRVVKPVSVFILAESGRSEFLRKTGGSRECSGTNCAPDNVQARSRSEESFSYEESEAEEKIATELKKKLSQPRFRKKTIAHALCGRALEKVRSYTSCNFSGGWEDTFGNFFDNCYCEGDKTKTILIENLPHWITKNLPKNLPNSELGKPSIQCGISNDDAWRRDALCELVNTMRADV